MFRPVIDTVMGGASTKETGFWRSAGTSGTLIGVALERDGEPRVIPV